MISGALDIFCCKAADLLEECGIHAVHGMDAAPRKAWDGPVAAVSLSRVECVSGGFQDYLGRETDPNGREYELYGKAVDLTLSMDLYAPRNGGETACRLALSLLAETVLCHGLGGLQVWQLDTDPVEFLERDGLYRLPVRCLCKGWLVACRDTDEGFIDFEVRGRKI